MNVEEYRKFMNDNRITVKEMASVIDMDESTWYRKIQKNGDNFTIKEMNTMIDAFKIPLDIAANIFFNEELA